MYENDTSVNKHIVRFQTITNTICLCDNIYDQNWGKFINNDS